MEKAFREWDLLFWGLQGGAGLPQKSFLTVSAAVFGSAAVLVRSNVSIANPPSLGRSHRALPVAVAVACSELAPRGWLVGPVTLSSTG